MSRVRIHGSVISFVVVGVLLAAAVIGGIYVVKNQLNGNLPEVSDVTEVANQPEEETEEATEPDQAPTESQPTPEDSQDQAPADQPEEAEPAPEDQPAPEPSQTEPDDETMPQTGVAEELPQTGIEDGFYVLAAVGILTGAVVAYRRSGLL